MVEVADSPHLQRVLACGSVERRRFVQREEAVGDPKPVHGGKHLAVQTRQALLGAGAGERRRGEESCGGSQDSQRDCEEE